MLWYGSLFNSLPYKKGYDGIKKYPNIVILPQYNSSDYCTNMEPTQDNVVCSIYGQLYYDAINDGTAKHQLILDPTADHQSWNNAYAETDFLRWMFDKKK
jgi:hypothetical protein